jgi:CubicO group peptidase (beta-lactamase class C family)
MQIRGLWYRSLLALSVLACTLKPSFSQTPVAGTQKSDNKIQALLVERLNPKSDTGIVVGVLVPGGASIVYAGTAGPGSSPALDGKTVFEIGSATKVFTGALLADMVERGEVRLDDPVAKFLPSSVRVPTKGGKPITLLDLATHTSGLPRLPANMKPKDLANPYADYTIQQMYDFLSGYDLPREIGESYQYSNLGVGLLGHVLSLKAALSYEELVKKRILEPLQMKDTVITLDPGLRSRLAVGHDASGREVANWDLPALAGAGALRSTASDMLKFLAANVGGGPLSAALHRAHVAQRSLGTPGGNIGLCWHLRQTGRSEIIWHNGGTAGYHSFIGFDPKTGAGVVVLHNSAASIDDIGFHLIDEQLPLAKPAAPPKARTEITGKPELLETYTGEYQLVPGFSLTVTRDGDKLFVEATGQSRLQVYPESETEFFYRVVDAQISFVKDAEGRITGLVLHQGGRDLPGKKIK